MAGTATSFNVSSASSILSSPSQISSLSISSKPFFLPMRSSSRTPLRLGFPRIMAFSSNDIKVGSNIEVDGAPWRVVVDVDPGLKGDTAQGGGTKPATLDTGAVVYVPLFVNVGDEILVDTRTGQYITRAEKN